MAVTSDRLVWVAVGSTVFFKFGRVPRNFRSKSAALNTLRNKNQGKKNVTMKVLFSKLCPAGIALSLPLLLAPRTPALCARQAST